MTFEGDGKMVEVKLWFWAWPGHIDVEVDYVCLSLEVVSKVLESGLKAT